MGMGLQNGGARSYLDFKTKMSMEYVVDMFRSNSLACHSGDVDGQYTLPTVGDYPCRPDAVRRTGGRLHPTEERRWYVWQDLHLTTHLSVTVSMNGGEGGTRLRLWLD